MSVVTVGWMAVAAQIVSISHVGHARTRIHVLLPEGLLGETLSALND